MFRRTRPSSPETAHLAPRREATEPKPIKSAKEVEKLHKAAFKDLVDECVEKVTREINAGHVDRTIDLFGSADYLSFGGPSRSDKNLRILAPEGDLKLLLDKKFQGDVQQAVRDRIPASWDLTWNLPTNPKIEGKVTESSIYKQERAQRFEVMVTARDAFEDYAS